MSLKKRTNTSPTKCQDGNTIKKQKLFDELSSNETSTSKDVASIFEDSGDFDFAALDYGQQIQPKPLDLTDWRRCIVDGKERQRRTFDLVLRVRREGTIDDKENGGHMSTTTCHLQGPWIHTRLEVGDLVSLKAVWDDQLNAYKVDKDNGFCITQPDSLISGTTVVGALFCMRKAVLADRFRGLDAGNKLMVIGTLVHELLQAVLGKRITQPDQIQSLVDELLQSQGIAHKLYASGMTRDETAVELQTFVPHILSFVREYVEGKEPAMVIKDTFQGKISRIQDIEENVWVPQLGLKGKIDVTVRVQRRRGRQNPLKFESDSPGIPLEMKTGRASFSMEHKGQVILYQMMLTALGKDTHSGLLLYLREGLMREIEGARNEQRDLLSLRNELATFLAHGAQLPDGMTLKSIHSATEGKFVQPFDLPEPISHHSACEKCAYATICCSFARTEPQLQLRDSHPLRKVMQSSTAHLVAQDYEYFIHWCWLLALEEQEAAKKGRNVRALWTDAPEVRERQGRALIDLQVSGSVVAHDGEGAGRHLHTFTTTTTKRQGVEEKEHDDDGDWTLSGFSLGDYVIVSTRKRVAVATGFVHALTKSSITLHLERNLLVNYADEHFIVDQYDSQSGNVFNYTNLGILLDVTPQSARLRQIIVERQPPVFGKVLPKVVASRGAEILQQLNGVQRAAVLKALTTETFMLIKGLPGTGKTQTLVALVRLLCMMGKSVLITSHTHSAVDNLLLRLKAHSVPLLRLGGDARIHAELRDCGETTATRACRSEADLERVYASFAVVGVTCLGSGHSIFQHRRFDYCIVDEATQVMQCTVLRPLFFSERFILVGDPEQLPPLVRSREARSNGASESLFERLDTPQATAVLTLQYRMNRTITALANALTYGGALQCASPAVEGATMRPLALTAAAATPKWLQRVLQGHLEQASFLLDTMNCAERSAQFAATRHRATNAAIEQSFGEDVVVADGCENKIKDKHKWRYTNYCDAAVVFRVVRSLLQGGYDAAAIGVVAPYRAQVELLRKLAAQFHDFYRTQQACLNFAAVEVNTVDQYQGRDKDIIIYSCTRTGSANEREMERQRNAEILEDKRRLTVAITRARVKLLLVGDAVCLQQYSPFQSLLAHIPARCRLSLEEGKQGFAWAPLLDELSAVIETP